MGESELTRGRKASTDSKLANYDQQPGQQTVASICIELSHNQFFMNGKIGETGYDRFLDVWALPLQALRSSLNQALDLLSVARQLYQSKLGEEGNMEHLAALEGLSLRLL